MRRLAVLAIAFAGCFQPSPPHGLACETECPSGEVCVAGRCHPEGYMPPDAQIDDTPPDVEPDANLDPDNDGVMDPMDNCPSVKNADQHDEDNDDLGDLCDPCPMFAGDDKDVDTDGVGDACDPDNFNAKQHWVLFEPFTSSNTMLWTYQNSPQNGQMVVENGNAVLKLQALHTRILMGGTLSNVSAADNPHQFAVFFEPLMSDASGYYWEGYDETAEGQHGVRIMAFISPDTYHIKDQIQYTPPLPTGAFNVQLDYNVTNQVIAAKGSGGGLPFMLSTDADAAVAIPKAVRLSFSTTNAKASFRYVGIIETTD